MKHARFVCILTLSLIALAWTISTASAQTAEPQPVVHAVIFTNHLCTFCRGIVEKDLPPAIEKFGKQLEILYLDVNTPEGEALYEAALEAFNVQRGVPLLFIGQETLGGVNIAPQLPSLVDTYLAQGGVDFPEIPGLDEYIAFVRDTPVQIPTETILNPISQNANRPVVHAVMFWMDGCPHCHDVLDNVLPPLQKTYGTQFDLVLIEVATVEDIEMLYQVAAAYNIPKEDTGVPFLIIDDQVLMGSDQIGKQLPGMIKYHLAQGGVDFPSNPTLTDLLPQSSPAAPSSTDELPSITEPSLLADKTNVQNNGFTLAIVIMVGMGLTLFYSLIALTTGKTLRLPSWMEWLIPALILIGIGVAAYLSYVETQSVEAICGPIGDCNTVQQSRYATLFGFLPIGVLGLLGYLGLLAAWLTRKYRPKFAKPADTAFFGMAFFAVLFSLYLTYLEPFVIRAVCIWCLTSAVIVTLLLLLGISPAVFQFRNSAEED